MTTPDPAQGRRQLRPTDVKRLNRDWRRRTEARLGLLVESVTQPFNMGSIIRSAAVFGVEHLWLAGNATPPTHRGVAKTALGTDRLVPWEHAGTPAEAAAAVRKEGLRLIAVELTADAVAYIPQIGRVGSLNVAVATAIALAEARRREWSG